MGIRRAFPFIDTDESLVARADLCLDGESLFWPVMESSGLGSEESLMGYNIPTGKPALRAWPYIDDPGLGSEERFYLRTERECENLTYGCTLSGGGYFQVVWNFTWDPAWDPYIACADGSRPSLPMTFDFPLISLQNRCNFTTTVSNVVLECPIGTDDATCKGPKQLIASCTLNIRTVPIVTPLRFQVGVFFKFSTAGKLWVWNELAAICQANPHSGLLQLAGYSTESMSPNYLTVEQMAAIYGAGVTLPIDPAYAAFSNGSAVLTGA